MEHVHIQFHVFTFLPIILIYRVNIGKRAILNKNIGIIGHFLKDRDFTGNIGNIGTLESLVSKSRADFNKITLMHAHP